MRELVENSLDASDIISTPSEIYIRLSHDGEENPENRTDQVNHFNEENQEVSAYQMRIEDNGSGVPPRHIPSAFGQVLFGSKYKLKQARGTFGLGGTMSFLYGQITTHKPVTITSSTGSSKIYRFKISIDIQRNRPIILDRKVRINKEQWRGTIVEFSLEGDYFRAMPKILEYLKQTALVNPYANITFVDPKGRLYKFNRATTKVPPPPKETLPHPYGVDVETIQRIIQVTTSQNLLDFMRTHFHRIGEITSRHFLEFAQIDAAKDPKKKFLYTQRVLYGTACLNHSFQSN